MPLHPGAGTAIAVTATPGYRLELQAMSREIGEWRPVFAGGRLPRAGASVVRRFQRAQMFHHRQARRSERRSQTNRSYTEWRGRPSNLSVPRRAERRRGRRRPLRAAAPQDEPAESGRSQHACVWPCRIWVYDPKAIVQPLERLRDESATGKLRSKNRSTHSGSRLAVYPAPLSWNSGLLGDNLHEWNRRCYFGEAVFRSTQGGHTNEEICIAPTRI